jgi:hypothetical protein
MQLKYSEYRYLTYYSIFMDQFISEITLGVEAKYKMILSCIHEEEAKAGGIA